MRNSYLSRRTPQCTAGMQDVVGFRWDRADLVMYYRLTDELLYDIDTSHDLLSNDSSVDETVILAHLRYMELLPLSRVCLSVHRYALYFTLGYFNNFYGT